MDIGPIKNSEFGQPGLSCEVNLTGCDSASARAAEHGDLGVLITDSAVKEGIVKFQPSHTHNQAKYIFNSFFKNSRGGRTAPSASLHRAPLPTNHNMFAHTTARRPPEGGVPHISAMTQSIRRRGADPVRQPGPASPPSAACTAVSHRHTPRCVGPGRRLGRRCQER